MNSIRVKIYRNDKDYFTSFGNYLQLLDQAYYLNQRFSLNSKIIIQEEDWPELKFISLPNVEIRKTNIIKNSKKLTKDECIEILCKNNCDFLKENNKIYIDELMFKNDYFEYVDDAGDLKVEELYYDKFMLKNIFSNIKFKHSEINEFLEDIFKDYVSLSIHRYNSISISKIELLSIPQEIRVEFYKNYAFQKTQKKKDFTSKFITDFEYYKVIEEVLDYDINQKFYIASDLPLKFYEYYKVRYRNIFNKLDFTKDFFNLLEKYYDKNIINENKDLLETLLDLFVMSKTKLIAYPYTSSISNCASKIANSCEIKLPLSNKNHQFNQIREAFDGKLKYSQRSALGQF